MQSEARQKILKICKEKYAFCINKYSQKYFPCVSKTFPALQQNSLCFPCLEKVRTKFLVFPVPWPPCVSGQFSLKSAWNFKKLGREEERHLSSLNIPMIYQYTNSIFIVNATVYIIGGSEGEGRQACRQGHYFHFYAVFVDNWTQWRAHFCVAPPPPLGNPGSATVYVLLKKTFQSHWFCHMYTIQYWSQFIFIITIQDFLYSVSVRIFQRNFVLKFHTRCKYRHLFDGNTEIRKGCCLLNDFNW